MTTSMEKQFKKMHHAMYILSVTIYLIIYLLVPSPVHAGESKKIHSGLFGLWAWGDWNEALQLVKDNGFDIAVGVSSKKYLDRAQELRLKCLVDMGVTREIVNDETRWKTYLGGIWLKVLEFKYHPAVFAWYIADEPDLQQIPVEKIKIIRDLIRSIDNSKPIFTVLNAPDKWDAYLQYFDIISIDPYIKRNPDGTHTDPQNLRIWLQKLRSSLKKKNLKKEVWAVLGAFEAKPKDPFTRMIFETPTPGEFQELFKIALEEKVEGILVYTLAFRDFVQYEDWNLPKNAPQLWDVVRKAPHVVDSIK
jgi:hypothetical protein